MVLLNTTFALSKECTKDTFLRILYSYYSDGPYWGDLHEPERMLKEDYSGTSGNNTIKSYILQNEVIVNVSENLERTYELLYIIIKDTPYISVRYINNGVDDEQRLSRAHLPQFLRAIFWKNLGGVDGVIPVTDRAIRIDADNLEMAELIFSGETFQNPIVYISALPNGTPVFDYETVAYQLAGTAHIVYEANPYVGDILQEKLAGKRPYNGAIKVLYPDGKDYILVTTDRTPESIKSLLTREVAKYTVNMPLKREFNVSNRKFQILADKLRGNEELSVIFDDILSEKDDKIKALEAEIEELKDKSGRMKSKADSLTYSLGNLIPSMGLSLDASEKEFYPGEFRDILIKILSKYKDMMTGDPNLEETRRYHILSDIINCNADSGISAKKINMIKSAIGNDVQMEKINFQKLRDAGFSCDTTGTHIKLVYEDDPRYTFTMSKTSSDYRAADNFIKTVQRTVF